MAGTGPSRLGPTATRSAVEVEMAYDGTLAVRVRGGCCARARRENALRPRRHSTRGARPVAVGGPRTGLRWAISPQARLHFPSRPRWRDRCQPRRHEHQRQRDAHGCAGDVVPEFLWRGLHVGVAGRHGRRLPGGSLAGVEFGAGQTYSRAAVRASSFWHTSCVWF